MDLNTEIQNLKVKIQDMLGKSPAPAEETAESSEASAEAPAPKTKKVALGDHPLVKNLNKFLGKYSFENERILGVDITPHYVRVCQMKNSYGQWSLNNLASACMESQFRKDDIQMNPDAYIENLKDLLAKNNIKTKNVAFSLPTSSSVIKVINMPDMDDDDFTQAAALGSIWESMVALDGSIGEYSVYYKILRHNPAPEQSEKPAVAEEAAPAVDAAVATEAVDAVATDAVAPEAQETPTEPPAETPAEAPAEEPAQPAETPDVTPAEEPAEAPTETPPAEEPAPETPAEIAQEPAAVETPAEEVVAEPTPTEEAAPDAEPVEEAVPAEETPTEENNEEGKEPPTMAEDEGAPDNNVAITSTEVDAIPAEAAAEIPTEAVDAEIAPDDAVDVAAEPVAEAVPVAGPTMDVLFVATKLADIHLHSDIITRAGLKPVLADIRCLALKHAFESNPKNLEEVREPYAFLEFGPDDNYIFVIDGDHTDIYNVFVSDDDINALIYHSEDIAQMQTFVQNFATQAEQTLKDHETKYGTEPINNIFVSSSAPLHVNDASSAPLIRTFVEQISLILGERAISECNFCKHIVVPEQFAKQVNAEGNIAAWVPIIGIASRKEDIFGYEEGETDPLNLANMLPNSAANKNNKRINILSTISAVLLFAGMMLGIGATQLDLNSYNKELTGTIKSMDGIEDEYNAKLNEANQLSLIMNQVNSLDDIKTSLPSNQGNILSAYRHIAKAIPQGIWLDELTYTNPIGIEIEGSSTSDDGILDFVKRLNDGKEFRKVSLKTMETVKAKDGGSLVGVKSSIKNFILDGSINNHPAQQGLQILSDEAKK